MSTLLEDQRISKMQTLVQHSATVIVEFDTFADALHNELPEKPTVSFVGTIKEHYTPQHMSWAVMSQDSCVIFCLNHIKQLTILQGQTKAFIKIGGL